MPTTSAGNGTETSAAPRGRSVLPLLIACAAYLVFRGVILWQAFDAVALPAYELHNMGNLARVLATGAPGPPLWQHYDNAGGQQLVALLAAPLYAAFGSSYLVLKLVPMLLGLGALVLMWRLMEREFGRLAAAVAAALYVLGPPTLVKYSLIASGNHFEHVFFALLLYTVFAAVHRAGPHGRGRAWLVALGAAAGASLWVYPGAVVTVLIFAALHVLLRGWRRALADLPLAAVGLALGLLPLIATNVANGGRSLDYTGDSLRPGRGNVLQRLGHNLSTMLGDLLPRAGVFEDFGPLTGRLAERLYLAAFVVSWIVVAAALLRARGRDWSRWRAAPLVLYLPVFLLVIGTGRWDFDEYGHPLEVGQFRYFVTHFAFAAMLVGLAVSRLAARGGRARAAAGLLAATALLPCLNTLPIAAPWPGTRGAGLRYEGHHFPYYALILLAYAERDPATGGLLPDEPAITHWLRELPPRHALDAWTGVAYFASTTRVERRGEKALTGGGLVDLHARLDGRPPAVQLALARGIGSALRGLARGSDSERELLRGLLLRVEKQGHPLAPALVEGLCLEQDATMTHEVADRLDKSFAVAALVPPSLVDAYRRGLGIQLGRLVGRGIEVDLDAVRGVLAALPPAARADVAFGLGWGFAELQSVARLAAALDALSQGALLTDALRGAGACLRHLDGPTAVGDDEAGLDAASRAALESGRRWPAYPSRWTRD